MYKLMLSFLVLLYGSNVLAQTNYYPSVGALNGFKDTYSPNSIGIDGNLLSVEGTKFVITQKEQGSFNKAMTRVFIPPGVVSVGLSFFAYSGEQIEIRVAMQMFSPPVVSLSEFNNGFYGSHRPNSLPLLLSGQVLNNYGGLVTEYACPYFVSPCPVPFTNVLTGPSGIQLIYQDDSMTLPSNKGGWLYVNTLTAPYRVYKSLDARISVDSTCYRKWFEYAKFDADGNPREDVEHTCDSPALPPVSTMVAIRLSTPSIENNSQTGVTISPVPADAILPVCTAVLPLFNIPNPYVKIEGGEITLTANGRAITETKTIQIQCGSFAASLTIVPGVTEKVELDGSLTLIVPLRASVEDIGRLARVFVAVRIPRTQFFGASDLWFFRTPNGWVDFISPVLELLVFNEYSSIAVVEELVIPTGLPKDLLQNYAAEVHVGYQTQGGQFKNSGIVWK